MLGSSTGGINRSGGKAGGEAVKKVRDEQAVLRPLLRSGSAGSGMTSRVAKS